MKAHIESGNVAVDEHVNRLKQALQERRGVVITYISAGDSRDHDFLLYPKRIFERDGHLYVEGWSAFQPKRIMLIRGSSKGSGKARVFRVDRLVAVGDKSGPDYSLTGYMMRKIRRRGVIPGIWGLFLDFLVLAFFVGLFFSLIRYIF